MLTAASVSEIVRKRKELFDLYMALGIPFSEKKQDEPRGFQSNEKYAQIRTMSYSELLVRIKQAEKELEKEEV